MHGQCVIYSLGRSARPQIDSASLTPLVLSQTHLCSLQAISLLPWLKPGVYELGEVYQIKNDFKCITNGFVITSVLALTAAVVPVVSTRGQCEIVIQSPPGTSGRCGTVHLLKSLLYCLHTVLILKKRFINKILLTCLVQYLSIMMFCKVFEIQVHIIG